ncbi:sensor histidine kinase [Phosphitispora fastidiosa]|uniref:sensor histidine kinase n=1 Tax=Phosphitispora fastidiosa TaxID=2837202 RepID=UPI001E342B27|nr:ATP-binding protein [Phosphitispora fastidiosa]MBU7007273.1 signal transduction histidine kinase [Phosphitispora fastidiosa]
MEKMPILVLLLYSIPESTILISLSAAIYGYKVKENFYRIVLLGTSLAVITYIVRALPELKFGLNVLIEIPVFIILTAKYLKISFIKSFFYIFTGFIIIALLEYITYPVASLVFNMPVKEIFSNTLYRLITGWSYLLLMIAVTVILLKKKVSLVSATSFFYPKTRSKKINLVLISLVMLQAFLSGVMNMIIFNQEYKLWPLLDNIAFTRIAGLLLFTVPLVSIFLVKRLFTLSEQETITETQEAFIDNINKLFTTIRGQRHDFIHHVQVIYSMLQNDQLQEAKSYMENLLGEIQSVSRVIKVKDPVLSALFNTKTAVAERLNIILDVRQETPLEGLKLKPYEVVKILGNLIDNALEAVADEPPEFRTVKVSLKKFSFVFIFEVVNQRPLIDPLDIDKLFEPNYTTKKNHSGLGLAVVKQIVDQIGGEIIVKSSEEKGTSFSVIIPVK